MKSPLLSPLLVLLFVSAFASGQSNLTSGIPIDGAALHTDSAILRSALEQLHPGLYRYSSRQEMDRRFERLSRELEKDQSLGQVYLKLAAFTAYIRCGHTFPNPTNQSKSVTKALFEANSKLPFLYRWIDGQMIVTRDLTPQRSLPVGTEVLSVNGVGSRTLLSGLLRVASSDGANDAKRVDLSQEQGRAQFENPDIFLPMLAPGKTGLLNLRIKPAGSNLTSKVTVTNLTAAQSERALTFTETADSGTKPLFTLRYMPSGAALLTMPSWVMFHSTWHWQDWLNASLDEVIQHNAPALIVDLRGNSGGDDVGAVILARLPRRAAAASDFARLVRYRSVPAGLNPYLSTWDDSFRDWGNRAVELTTPWPTAPDVPYYRQIQAQEPSPVVSPPAKMFGGRVYVLTDAANSSATFNFARAVQQEHLGLLVGEATGGNQRGINGGAFFFLKLPHSGIEVDLPLIGYFPATAQPDSGLTPDVPAKVGTRDIELNLDPALSRIEQLIRASARSDHERPPVK